MTVKTDLHKKAWFKKGDRFKHKSAPGIFTVVEVQKLPPEGNVMYILHGEDPKDVGGTLHRFQRELMRDFLLIPTEGSDTEPYFYTGKHGPEHFEVAAKGKDYIAINLRSGWVVGEDDPDNPSHAQQLLDACDHGSWVRIRATSADNALKVADDCEDQYECFINNWENWTEIVLTPINEREF